VSQVLVQFVIKLVSVGSHEHDFIFNDFLNSDRDVEERTASEVLMMLSLTYCCF